jgi:hypothetical protein
MMIRLPRRQPALAGKRARAGAEHRVAAEHQVAVAPWARVQLVAAVWPVLVA